MTRKVDPANPWRPLEKHAEIKAQQAAQRVAEQQRRLSAAMHQQKTIDQYAQELSAKSSVWMGADAGCQAFLLGGIQQFQDTIRAVSKTQQSSVENLLSTRDVALEDLRSADAYRRRIVAISDQHALSLKQAAHRAERRLEDDLRNISPTWVFTDR